MDTALPQKFPFILDRNLAKANCTENHVCTSCDKVVLALLINFLWRAYYSHPQWPWCCSTARCSWCPAVCCRFCSASSTAPTSSRRNPGTRSWWCRTPRTPGCWCAACGLRARGDRVSPLTPRRSQVFPLGRGRNRVSPLTPRRTQVSPIGRGRNRVSPVTPRRTQVSPIGRGRNRVSP